MEGFLGELRIALRRLRRAPLFTLICIVTLALGIGANTAVFSVLNAVLMRSLPVQDADGLYYVRMANNQAQPPGATNTGDANTSFSLSVFEALSTRSDVIANLIAYAPLAIGRTSVRLRTTPLQAEGEEVSGNFFSGLHAPLLLGRGFSPSDQQSHSSVAVISYSFWGREFGREPNAVGSTLYVKGFPFTIIGITNQGFFGVEPAVATDFWVPLQSQPALNAWGNPDMTLYGAPSWWCLRMMARLRPGMTSEKAQASLSQTFLAGAQAGLGQIDSRQWQPLLLFEEARGIEGYKQLYSRPMHILTALVILVLATATINVSLMLQARHSSRVREYALQLALGSGTWRLFRVLVTESAILVTTGSIVGWLSAMLGTRVLSTLSHIETGLSPNTTVLYFTILLSVCITPLVGVAPLMSVYRQSQQGLLRSSGSNSTQGRGWAYWGRLLLSVQIAFCLLLLTTASLLLRTLRNYEHQPLGMRADRILVFGITPHSNGVKNHANAVYHQLLSSITSLPGVEGVTLSVNRPGSGWSSNSDFAVDGYVQRGDTVRKNSIGSRYFTVVGTPVIAGRDFSDADGESQNVVVIVNKTFANRYFPQGEVLGHAITANGVNARIIGVVSDSQYESANEPAMPMAYYDVWQQDDVGPSTIQVRAHGQPLALLSNIESAVRTIDPDLSFESPMTQAAQFALSYAQPSMFAVLAEAFGALAAVLVAAGLYGALSYRVSQRRTEIGVRMALGAKRLNIMWWAMRETLILIGIGISVGIPLTLIATRGLEGLLWKLSPTDPQSFCAGIVGVLVVCASASWLPAYRAASVNPALAVRSE